MLKFLCNHFRKLISSFTNDIKILPRGQKSNDNQSYEEEKTILVLNLTYLLERESVVKFLLID